MDLRNEYIDRQADLLYNAFFYKHILENKYIKNFGHIDLKKKEHIYNSMIMNKHLEANFYMPERNSVVDTNLIDFLAKKEFDDLDKQISQLKENIEENDKEYERLMFFEKKNIKLKIKNIVAKASPTLNRNSKASLAWDKFIKALEESNWKRVFNIEANLSEFRMLKTKISQDELEQEIDKIKRKNRCLHKRYPFNYEKILDDDQVIEDKLAKEKKDIDHMKMSYEKMADIYLNTSGPSKWTS